MEPPALLQQRTAVPRISEFFGIAVSMYYDDHVPPHEWAVLRRDELLANWELARAGWPLLPIAPLG